MPLRMNMTEAERTGKGISESKQAAIFMFHYAADKIECGGRPFLAARRKFF